MAGPNPGTAELASTLQAASLNRQPSPEHDVNPSTSASTKEPVHVVSSSSSSVDSASSVADDEIPVSVLRPQPRRAALPPLPDLRFEQSYLKSIERADGWKGVLWITVRDQVLFPFLQGTLWELIRYKWRHMNREHKFSGQNVGARIRRWWWGVNNWAVPGDVRSDSGRNQKLAEEMREVRRSLSRLR
ncbi:hypothetical protein BDY21DRAFT_330019 [Lineolata rhizophorae]|uniref:DUF1770-domain-containing protein n=1 Tax=Lineolata rhizophorae TaxID=578093 RepID=A0A6A6PD80_9PEZI|nr:hypothetical protein BDY21DRAFT_330019 [Lineolata rhizophorae]